MKGLLGTSKLLTSFASNERRGESVVTNNADTIIQQIVVYHDAMKSMAYPYFVKWVGYKVYVKISEYDCKVRGKSFGDDVAFNADLPYEIHTAVCACAVCAKVVDVVKTFQ